VLWSELVIHTLSPVYPVFLYNIGISQKTTSLEKRLMVEIVFKIEIKMIKKMQKRGFTLIELLVVIAIIGILSSVVLASLSTARSKGTDAKVQSQLASARSQAEIFYGNQSPNNYGTAQALGACTTGSLFTASSSAGGLADLLVMPSGYSTQCVTNPTSGTATAWAVKASNNATYASGTKFWCVDSTGKSQSYASDPTVTSAVCQ
jgi:prepilin-type N-terminal cleavage/methylation domain-containing protein